MNFASNSLNRHSPGRAARAGIAGVLCVLMVDLPLLAEVATRRVPTASSAGAQIQGEDRVLHALNRLTFGPTPGQVAIVEKMGLKAWFEQQLNPSGIDDSALDAKLAQFPAMQMSTSELAVRYPRTQTLREMSLSNKPLPTDPTEHGIYKDEIAFYKQAKEKEAVGQPGSAAMANGGMADGAEDNDMSEASPASPAAKKYAKKVDLLGEGKSDNVTSKKSSKGSDDEMAVDAGKVANGDINSNSDDINAYLKGKKEHEDKYFPAAQATQILSLEPEARVQAILALEPDQLLAFRKSLSYGEVFQLGQGLNPLQRETLAALQGSGRVVGGEIMESRMMRDVYSDRQLEAVMTDFWLNHFNVYVKKNQLEPYLLPAYEREVIRPNALGNFETLLVATAKSPAMLLYLDNYQSVGPDSDSAKKGSKYAQYVKNPQVKQSLKDRGLNENYARELMELHTVGVGCEVSKDHPKSALNPACGNGYTQADVTNVAQVLTGWTMDRVEQRGGFRFDEGKHEPGAKQVLGTTIPAGGEQEGMQLLHMLATSPATARFISTKLAVRFVSDTPPEALIDRMAKSFTASNGDIKTVLRTMFNSPEFWSTSVYRAKVKTPEEFVISAVRASGATVQDSLPLIQALSQLGMGFYGMQTPNGYSWISEPWVGTGALVSRMNFALVLSGNRLAGTRVNWDSVMADSAGYKPVNLTTATNGSNAAVIEKERLLERMLIGQPVSERTRATVLAQSENTSAADQAAKNFASQGQMQSNGDGAMAMGESSERGGFAGGDMSQFRAQQQPVDRQAAVIAGLLLGSPEFQRR